MISQRKAKIRKFIDSISILLAIYVAITSPVLANDPVTNMDSPPGSRPEQISGIKPKGKLSNFRGAVATNGYPGVNGGNAKRTPSRRVLIPGCDASDSLIQKVVVEVVKSPSSGFKNTRIYTMKQGHYISQKCTEEWTGHHKYEFLKRAQIEGGKFEKLLLSSLKYGPPEGFHVAYDLDYSTVYMNDANQVLPIQHYYPQVFPIPFDKDESLRQITIFTKSDRILITCNRGLVITVRFSDKEWQIEDFELVRCFDEIYAIDGESSWLEKYGLRDKPTLDGG